MPVYPSRLRRLVLIMLTAASLALPLAAAARPKVAAPEAERTPAAPPKPTPKPMLPAPSAPAPQTAPPETPAETSGDERGSLGRPRIGHGTGGPSELRAPKGPGLPVPAGAAKLWVNGAIDDARLLPDEPVEVRWDVGAVPRATGIALWLSDRPLDESSCRGLSVSGLQAFGLTGSGVHPGVTGSTSFTVRGLGHNARLHVVGCPLRGKRLNKVVEPATNVVRAKHAGAPDLIVSALYVVKGELRFRVKNQGKFTKAPSDLKYALIREDPRIGGGMRWRQHVGTAANAGLSRLHPGQESGENRVIDPIFEISGDSRLTLCINSAKTVVEADHDNNCRVLQSRAVLPDLEVVSASLLLRDRKQPDRCKPWHPAYVPSQLGVCKLDGLDVLVAKVQNRSRSARSTRTTARVRIFAGTKLVYEETAAIGPLAPRAAEEFEIVVLRSRDRSFRQVLFEDHNIGSCCTGDVTIDPGARIPELNENNNKLAIDLDVER